MNEDNEIIEKAKLENELDSITPEKEAEILAERAKNQSGEQMNIIGEQGRALKDLKAQEFKIASLMGEKSPERREELGKSLSFYKTMVQQYQDKFGGEYEPQATGNNEEFIDTYNQSLDDRKYGVRPQEDVTI